MPEQIKKLQDQVDALSRKLEIVSKEAGIYLDRNIDIESKNIIAQTISQRLPVIWWDEIFYISSVFESIDRLLTAGTGSGSISSNGLELNNTGGSISTLLSQEINSPVDASKETLMSTTVKINNVSDAAFNIDIISDGSAQVRIKVNAGTIQGQCSDGTNTTTIDLGTATDAQILSLECHYYPGTKVDFFVDDILVGTITSNLPPITTSVDRLIGFALENPFLGSVATATVTYFSLLQRTKNG